jgi:hypothetical protein
MGRARVARGHGGMVLFDPAPELQGIPMTDDKKPNEHPLSERWPTLAPEVKRAFQQSLAEWLTKEYAPPAELSAELRALLSRMEEARSND